MSNSRGSSKTKGLNGQQHYFYVSKEIELVMCKAPTVRAIAADRGFAMPYSRHTVAPGPGLRFNMSVQNLH